MDIYQFVGIDRDSLRAFIQTGIVRAGCSLLSCGAVASVSLWNSSGMGLRIASQMYDVAERQEVGVLVFSSPAVPVSGEEFEDLDGMQGDQISAFKLELSTSQFVAESGLVLEAGNRAITIVAGSMPYSLAVLGVGREVRTCPEYALEDYRRVAL